MLKPVKYAAAAVAGVAAICAAAAGSAYGTRLQTIRSIRKYTDYEDYNLYSMDVKYSYDLDKMLADGRITDTQSYVDTIVAEAMPLVPIKMKAKDFGCSAFAMETPEGHVLMGRNYDFRYDTSAMLVRCAPKGWYRSVAFCALDNLDVVRPCASLKGQLSCLPAPFVCLDGMNEQGVSIAVLTLDSAPTVQDTPKGNLPTGLAIRLVLDRAATTQEAVDLLTLYDMIAVSGRDYHFYIADASGDARVVEYDPEDPSRPLVVTPCEAITNFFYLHRDKVLPNQKNGIYGHGRERYDAIMAVIDEHRGELSVDLAWEALKAASQEPDVKDVTSNTQWSIVFDDTQRCLEVALRRKWNDVEKFAV